MTATATRPKARVSPNPAIAKRTLSIPEAAAELGYSENHLYRMAQSGELPVIRIGRAIRVSRDFIDRLLSGQTAASDDRPKYDAR